CRIEDRKGDPVIEYVEGHLDLLADAGSLGGCADESRHHARAFLEFDNCDHVGDHPCKGFARRAADLGIGVERAVAGALHPLQRLRAAKGTKGARIEMASAALLTARHDQPPFSRCREIGCRRRVDARDETALRGSHPDVIASHAALSPPRRSVQWMLMTPPLPWTRAISASG